MKICLLAEPASSPVVMSALRILGENHDVRHCDGQSTAAVFDGYDADVYLLKSRNTLVRRHAETARRHGAVVINTPSATAAALDRAMMARLLGAARVPVPATRGFAQLGQFAAVAEKSVTNWPVVIKSRRSRRGDLVRRVDTRADLAALLADWSTEPVIVQEYVASDGYDLKFWVVGPSITVARRPSALEVRTKTQDVALDIEAIPASWRRAVLAAGAALGLEIYGVDGLITGGRMVVVDVNPFPGFRSAAGADRALADLVERRAREAGRST